MPRWVEERGITLEVPAGASERFVRLSLMARSGFAGGWWNVREARAEPGPGGATDIRIVGNGRALSWRWLRRPEANRLLEERRRALLAMGYRPLPSAGATRGRWDWLYDLVHRRLQAGDTQEDGVSPSTALRDALSRLGLQPEAILQGLASVLGVSPEEFTHPTPPRARRTDAAELSVLLPFLLHHEREEIRAIGERWLHCPPVAYQLSPHQLALWLQSDARMATLLAPRIRREGLALLGPQALTQLARSGHPAIQGAARAWVQRLGE